jgi:hypothetical protein
MTLSTWPGGRRWWLMFGHNVAPARVLARAESLRDFYFRSTTKSSAHSPGIIPSSHHRHADAFFALRQTGHWRSQHCQQRHRRRHLPLTAEDYFRRLQVVQSEAAVRRAARSQGAMRRATEIRWQPCMREEPSAHHRESFSLSLVDGRRQHRAVPEAQRRSATCGDCCCTSLPRWR